MTREDKNPGHANTSLGCLSRRAFLLAGGSATAVMAAGCAGVSFPEGFGLQVAKYPRRKIALLSDIQPHVPLMFSYPDEGPHYASFLVDVGDRAAGGVGLGSSIVAFNGTCPHMGGPLIGTYKKEYGVTGPCPLHLTTFDLRRHGMVVSGHATESLPQIQLEVDGNNVYATGVMGLIYGLQRNTA